MHCGQIWTKSWGVTRYSKSYVIQDDNKESNPVAERGGVGRVEQMLLNELHTLPSPTTTTGQLLGE